MSLISVVFRDTLASGWGGIVNEHVRGVFISNACEAAIPHGAMPGKIIPRRYSGVSQALLGRIFHRLIFQQNLKKTQYSHMFVETRVQN